MYRNKTPLLLPVIAIALANMVWAGPTFAYGEIDTSFKAEGAKGYQCTGGFATFPDGSTYSGYIGPEGRGFGAIKHLANGVIDRAWGKGGFVETTLPPMSGRLYSITMQPTQLFRAVDGALHVAGESIFRYQTDGTLDTSYGNSGISDAVTPFGLGFRYLNFALQADGTIVVRVGIGATPVFVRIDAKGRRDPAFTGIVPNATLDTEVQGGYFTLPPDAADGTVYAWSVYADDSIQVATHNGLTGDAFRAQVRRYRKDLAMADPSFDGRGKLVPRQGVANWISPIVKVQPDGALVIAASDCLDSTCTKPGVSVRRFDASGNLDTRFGTGGRNFVEVYSTYPHMYQIPGALWLETTAISLCWSTACSAPAVFSDSAIRASTPFASLPAEKPMRPLQMAKRSLPRNPTNLSNWRMDDCKGTAASFLTEAARR